jgi:hypothetical protein
MKSLPIRMAGIAALCLTAPGHAHHSFAMFDMQKTMTLQGTVREFQWTNPHCFIQLLVATPQGPAEWSLEMHSPTASMREGWRRGSLKAGDRISVDIHPLRHGGHGGALVLARDAQGKPLHNPPVKP